MTKVLRRLNDLTLAQCVAKQCTPSQGNTALRPFLSGNLLYFFRSSDDASGRGYT